MSETLRDAAARYGVLIGAACSPELIEREPGYSQTLAREFNCIVAENCMKFVYLEPERGRFDFIHADTLARFAAQNSIRLRGHTLVWHAQIPAWLTEREYSRTEALDILNDHILGVAGHFRDTVFCWDVVNEALGDEGGWRRDTPWFRSIGVDFLDYAFRWAHEAAPDALLVYNDYGMEQPGVKADACYAMLRDMRSRGVPVHGVGFQFHLTAENRLDHAACSANMRRFRDLGLDVQFTEMDMGIKKPITEDLRQVQAEEYASRIRIGLDVGASAFVFWGFTDCYSWIPHFTKGEYDEPLLFDRDYRPKPAYAAVRAALRREA